MGPLDCPDFISQCSPTSKRRMNSKYTRLKRLHGINNSNQANIGRFIEDLAPPRESSFQVNNNVEPGARMFDKPLSAYIKLNHTLPLS